MFTSTTAQLLGGSFVLFFSDTVTLLWSSLVSATVSPSMVGTKELCLVQCTPAACCFAKSTPSTRLLVKFSHTRKVCLNFFPPISISQLIFKVAPRLVPFAPTTVGKFLCPDLCCSFVIFSMFLLTLHFLVLLCRKV